MKKLESNPKQLEILGNGRQVKSYLHVSECVEGMLCGVEKSSNSVNVFNLGGRDQIKVSRIAEIVVEESGLKGVELKYTGGKQGWPGDVTEMVLSTEKLGRLGWTPKLNSERAVKKAVKELLK
jgi:UDP-glucose 4-epimerase